MSTSVISAPAIQRAPGTYNLPSTKLPAEAQAITIAFERASLSLLVGPVAEINIEGSDDNGVTWVGLGGCTLEGGIAIGRDGQPLAETFYTVQFTDRDGNVIPFPASYRVRGTVKLLQVCTAGAVVRVT